VLRRAAGDARGGGLPERHPPLQRSGDGVEQCLDQVLPRVEACGTEGAEDEDCDGLVNELCAVWTRTFGGPGRNDSARDIAIVPGGDLAVVGQFEDHTVLGGTQISSSGTSAGFVARLTADGEDLWTPSSTAARSVS
jgi:hypothetical protein